MKFSERGLVFDSGDNKLVGVATLPEQPNNTGVLILVGGPQYRVGSHRQFTLLARYLAEQGYASLRFDCAGMGDSEGAPRGFDQSAPDVSAAKDALRTALPQVENIVLWGLCDAASAALIYAQQDSEIAGLVLLNPWVHQGEYLPRMRLNRYRAQIFHRSFWSRLLRHPTELMTSVKDVFSAVLGVLGGTSSVAGTAESFVNRMRDALLRYPGPVQIILSQNDLTASEFSALVSGDRQWQVAMTRDNVSEHRVADADHTFSRRNWRAQVEQLTLEHLETIAKGTG